MTCDWSFVEDMVEDIVFVVCCCCCVVVVVISVRLFVDHLFGLCRGCCGAWSTCIGWGCCCCWCWTVCCCWMICCCWCIEDCCCWACWAKGDLVLFNIARSCIICAIVGYFVFIPWSLYNGELATLPRNPTTLLDWLTDTEQTHKLQRQRN